MLFPTGILTALIVVVAAIIIDTVFGAIKAAQDDAEQLQLPAAAEVLATASALRRRLGILALAATFVGEPFTATLLRVVSGSHSKVYRGNKDKLEWIFGMPSRLKTA